MNTTAATDTDYLVAVTVCDMTFHAGHHAKHVPAGTKILVRPEAFESDSAAVYVRVAHHPRISEVVYRSAFVPA